MRRPLVDRLLLFTCSAFLAVASAQDADQQVRNGELVDTDDCFQIVRPDRT